MLALLQALYSGWSGWNRSSFAMNARGLTSGMLVHCEWVNRWRLLSHSSWVKVEAGDSVTRGGDWWHCPSYVHGCLKDAPSGWRLRKPATKKLARHTKGGGGRSPSATIGRREVHIGLRPPPDLVRPRRGHGELAGGQPAAVRPAHGSDALTPLLLLSRTPRT